jgi:hypothetical protein
VTTALALADSAVGNQNPTFTAFVSATTDGADPNVATDGDKISVNVSVTNDTAEAQYARVYLISNLPKAHDFNRLRLLGPGETWKWSKDFKINGEKTPAGSYSFTVLAFGGGISIDASAATATVSVQ